MQPRSQAFVISEALRHARSQWHVCDASVLRSGRRALVAVSPKRRFLLCVARARSSQTRDDAKRWLARACRFLGHLAVPARAPLAAFLENQDDATLKTLASTPSAIVWPDDARAIADVLVASARFASKLDLGAQARVIVPLAIEATAALFRAVPPPR